MSKADEPKCPVNHTAGGGTSNQDWWPNHLPLELLHQHSAKSNPLGSSFSYAREFSRKPASSRRRDWAGEHLRHRLCGRRDHQRPGDHLDKHTHPMEQRLFQEPVWI